MRAFLSRSALFCGLLVATASLTTGCAKRFRLTPGELERVQTEAGVNPLRVYTSKKLIAIYLESGVEEEYDVDREIVEGSDRRKFKDVTTKNTAGLILKIEDLNGKPLLWVTFDSSCKTPECAYGFVETEDKPVPPHHGAADVRLRKGANLPALRVEEAAAAAGEARVAGRGERGLSRQEAQREDPDDCAGREEDRGQQDAHANAAQPRH